MSNLMELSARQQDDRAELVRVRAELEIQRKALVNLEDREEMILRRMAVRGEEINDVLTADRHAGLKPALVLEELGEDAPSESELAAPREVAF